MRAATRASFARQHLDALLVASEVRENIRRMYFPRTASMQPEKVIAILNKAKVRYVLMGTFGINGYRDEARATQDVDVLVRSKDHERAVKAIKASFPKLEMEDFPIVTRFRDPANKKPLIDLMKPRHDALLAVFKNSILVGKSHRVPTLEMALVSKFAAMVSPFRDDDKKLVDGGDFVNMVKHRAKSINLSKLKKLGEKVYRGGGAEISKMVADINAGRRIQF
ncbi:MAG: hypothetical protein FJ271_18425 [Planctomycetes bacterium]|nr:hypothetical protein [Planctomycetota bacterium]